MVDVIELLRSNDEIDRAYAVEDIVANNCLDGIILLFEQLTVETSRYVKELIVDGLQHFREPEIVNRAVSLLESEEPFIRNAAIDILASQGELALEPVVHLLSHKDKDIRKFAVEILGKMEIESKCEYIAEALNDKDPNIVMTAVEYLGKTGGAEFVPRIADLFSHSTNLLVRCACLEALASLPWEGTMEAVNQIIGDPGNMQLLEQYSYLRLLAAKGDTTCLPLVTKWMKQYPEIMTKELINALFAILSREKEAFLPEGVIEAIQVMLSSPINDINKYEILEFLGEYQNPEIYSILQQYLVPENKLVCLGAIEGLASLGRKEAIPLLVDLKNMIADEELMEAVENALDALGARKD